VRRANEIEDLRTEMAQNSQAYGNYTEKAPRISVKELALNRPQFQ
jgi:hypothetical protein